MSEASVIGLDLAKHVLGPRGGCIAALSDLNLTGLDNRLERRREALNGGRRFREGEEADHLRAHVPALAELHDAIDRAPSSAPFGTSSTRPSRPFPPRTWPAPSRAA